MPEIGAIIIPVFVVFEKELENRSEKITFC